MEILTKFIEFIEFIKNKKVWYSFCYILAGVLLLPLFIVFIYFINGHIKDLWFAVWQYNNDYYLPANSNPIILGYTIPIQSLYFRAFLMVSVLITTLLSFLKGQFKNGNIGQNGFIILNWLSVATFSVFISERPYPHYLQQPLPITVILVIWIISLIKLPDFTLTSKFSVVIASLVFFQILLTNFLGGNGVLNYFNLDKYWGPNGFNSVITGQQSLANWQRGFDANVYDKTNLLVPEIKKYSNLNDYIFISSTMPEIYAESGRINAYKYVVGFQPPIGISIPDFYLILTKKAKLIITDNQSSLTEKLMPYLKNNFLFKETLADRYSIWINISTDLPVVKL